MVGTASRLSESLPDPSDSTSKRAVVDSPPPRVMSGVCGGLMPRFRLSTTGAGDQLRSVERSLFNNLDVLPDFSELLSDLGDLFHELWTLRSIELHDVLGLHGNLLFDLGDLFFKELGHDDVLQPAECS